MQGMRFLPAALAVALFVTACATSPRAPVVRLEHTGLIQAWPEGLKDAKGKPAHFESSAVTLAGDRVLIASDKPVPRADVSNVIQVPLGDLLNTNRSLVPRSRVKQVSGTALSRVAKLESMTRLSGGYCLAMTAFDRDEDAFNTVVVWPESDPSSARIVNPTTRNGVTSSSSLREPIRRALATARWPEGPPYFKIEGMTVIHSFRDEARLILGVREYGKSYRAGEFSYAVRLLEGTIKQESDGSVTVGDTFKPLLSISPSQLRRQGIKRTVAVSSLESDDLGNLWGLLSYEENDGADMGAYLIRIVQKREPSRFSAKARAQVARGEDGAVFEFPHKAEGLTLAGTPLCVMSGQLALIVADEDRRLAAMKPSGKARTPSQCVYGVLRIDPVF